MADIQDYLAASRETDTALSSLDVYAGQVEDGRSGDVALATALAGRAVALAIREASVRADYVARDMGKREERAAWR